MLDPLKDDPSDELSSIKSTLIPTRAKHNSHHNTLDQLDQVDILLPASSREVAVSIPQDPIVGCWMPMYEALVHDSENNDDYLCYYSGTFALGGDTEKEFAKHH